MVMILGVILSRAIFDTCQVVFSTGSESGDVFFLNHVPDEMKPDNDMLAACLSHAIMLHPNFILVFLVLSSLTVLNVFIPRQGCN